MQKTHYVSRVATLVKLERLKRRYVENIPGFV